MSKSLNRILARRLSPIMLPKIVALSLAVAGVIQPAADFPRDPQGPAPRSETFRSFDCGFITASIRYRYERLEDNDNSVLQRFTLLDLAVNERSLEHAQLVRVQHILTGLATLEGVSSYCENGQISLIISGVASAPGGAAQSANRSDIRFWSVRMSRNGVIQIR